MAEWSKLLPPAGNAPREVEAARREVEALRAKLPAQRQALSDAQAAVTTAEADDRQRMAEQLRAGRAAKADVAGVEKAQQRVASVRREGEALLLAIQTAEDALGETVCTYRAQWLKTAHREERAARERGRRALDELTGALQGLAEAVVTRMWLAPEGGLDREQRPRHAAPGTLGGSERVTGNRSALPTLTVLGWVADALREPEPPKPPARAQPLQPVPSACS